MAGRDHRLLIGARRGTADVERTHGQLGAGLTDRLRGDDAERVAFLGQTVAGQIAAVTLDADAAQSFAGQRGTDQHALDAALLDQFDHFRRELLAGAHDQAAVRKRGVADILRTEAAQNAVLQRHDGFVTLDDRAGPDALAGTAILFAADDILRDVDQTAGHRPNPCGRRGWR